MAARPGLRSARRSIGKSLDLALRAHAFLERWGKSMAAPHHELCPYSNATRDGIDVTLRVDGTELAETEVNRQRGKQP